MCIIFVETQEDNILNLVDSPLSQARPTKLFRTEDSPGMSSTPAANVPPGKQPTALFHAANQVHQSYFFSPPYAFSSFPHYPPMVPQSAMRYGTNRNVNNIHVPIAKFWCL